MASSAEIISAGATLRPRSRAAPVQRSRAPAQSNGASLAALVEGEIIPRLMMAHATAPAPTGRAAVMEGEVDAFAPLALDRDAATLLLAAERLIARGVSIDCIMVDLLAPTARRLGLWWEEDRCDFVEVTMGLWRLQEVVREISARIGPPHAGAPASRRALFAAMPGDQHDFGAVIVGDMFRRHGWDTDGAPGADMPELLAAVGMKSYDLIGLTVSCDCHSARLPSVILALRSVSLNPRARVLVGGRIFVEDPALAARVGADGTAPDARGALAVADRLVRAAAEAMARI